MSAPTTLTVTFQTFASGSPTGQTTTTVTLPTAAGSVAGVSQTVVPFDYTRYVRNAFLSGGFWFVNSTGVEQFIPWGTVIEITAQ